MIKMTKRLIRTGLVLATGILLSAVDSPTQILLVHQPFSANPTTLTIFWVLCR